MSHCSSCHRDAPEGARFCAHCGSAVIRAGGAAEQVDPLIGKTIKDTYLVEEIVGGGGMGKVYKAKHLTLDIPVALKVLKRELLDNPSLVQRFHREARAATRLRHPNVIGVTDFGQTEDGTLFMVMEFVAGRGLGRIIAEESPLSEPRVIRIGAQILAALAEAHAVGVLHRDLKPGNVMIEARRDEPDFVKVIDFGIAKIQVTEDGRGALTQAGLVVGTPCYMSPEQWNEEELDARSDLYSVGVILYEMLAGQKPYEADTPLAMLRRLVAERPVPPTQRRAGITVSAALESLVLKALSFHRADRPASADEMRAELLACASRPASFSGASEPKAGALRERAADDRAPETVVLPPPMPQEKRILERPTLPTQAPLPEPPASPGPRKVPSALAAAPTSGGRLRRYLPIAAGALAFLIALGVWSLRKPAPKAKALGVVAGRESADAAVTLPAAATAIADSSRDAGRSEPAVEATQPAKAAARDAGGASEGKVAAASAPERELDAGSAVAESAPRVAQTAARDAGGASEGRAAAASATEREVDAGSAVAESAPRVAQAAARDAGGASEGRAAAVSLAERELDAGSGVAESAPRVAKPTALRVETADEAAQPPAEGRAERKIAHSGEGARESRRPAAAKESPRRHGVVTERDVVGGIPTPPTSSGDGVLSIRAEPVGDVFVDDQAYGEAPREFRVAAGTYSVRVTNPKLGQQEMKIEVPAGKRVPWTADHFVQKK